MVHHIICPPSSNRIDTVPSNTTPPCPQHSTQCSTRRKGRPSWTPLSTPGPSTQPCGSASGLEGEPVVCALPYIHLGMYRSRLSLCAYVRRAPHPPLPNVRSLFVCKCTDQLNDINTHAPTHTATCSASRRPRRWCASAPTKYVPSEQYSSSDACDPIPTSFPRPQGRHMDELPHRQNLLAFIKLP